MKPMHISQIINKQLGKNFLYPVIKNWHNIVGPIIFKIAVPIKVKKNVLLVGVKNHQWLQELSFSKEIMLKKISKYSKGITDVQFLLKSDIRKKSDIKNDKKKTELEAVSRALTTKDISFIKYAVADV
ncbi:MAG: DUF721 domain-containing protein, partial [Proteobacteria bacterium]|nr:DUF721 domain-containing protein [Pseudomonadota bacterium]